MPAVQMVLFVWLVVRTVVRGQWRSVIVESGALSVMTTGTGMMLQWSANSWDSREQVGCFVVAISNNDSSWTWLLFSRGGWTWLTFANSNYRVITNWSRILHDKNFFSLCYEWTRLWILIWKVGLLSVKAKRVCLLRYGNRYSDDSRVQPCLTSSAASVLVLLLTVLLALD